MRKDILTINGSVVFAYVDLCRLPKVEIFWNGNGCEYAKQNESQNDFNDCEALPAGTRKRQSLGVGEMKKGDMG